MAGRPEESQLCHRARRTDCKKMEFKSWANRHDDTMQALLRSMLDQVTPEVRATLEPQGSGAELTFRLCEGLFINKRT